MGRFTTSAVIHDGKTTSHSTSTWSVHCTALHALHCTALHSTALHCTARHSTALHSTPLHSTPLHCSHPCVVCCWLQHGDNGAGVGASHQTGWTALVAKLIQQSGGVSRKERSCTAVPSSTPLSDPAPATPPPPPPGSSVADVVK